MTKQNFLFIFSLAVVCSFASAQSASVNAKKAIPPELMNTVQWEIQKNMSRGPVKLINLLHVGQTQRVLQFFSDDHLTIYWIGVLPLPE